jgi:hypothetical protein
METVRTVGDKNCVVTAAKLAVQGDLHQNLWGCVIIYIDWRTVDGFVRSVV